ncbi:MAG TPA: hypothetical protein VN648_08505, partial [Candidatus Methylomirabilis sp.]|nr:hypothetical protein [Candidatus Methylomirabilis sp.]
MMHLLEEQVPQPPDDHERELLSSYGLVTEMQFPGMRRAATTTGEPSVRAGLKQFLKVTRSYWPGLFRCYDAADLPRTNN